MHNKVYTIVIFQIPSKEANSQVAATRTDQKKITVTLGECDCYTSVSIQLTSIVHLSTIGQVILQLGRGDMACYSFDR